MYIAIPFIINMIATFFKIFKSGAISIPYCTSNRNCVRITLNTFQQMTRKIDSSKNICDPVVCSLFLLFTHVMPPPYNIYIYQLPCTHNIFVQCLNISADVNEKARSTLIGTRGLDDSWVLVDCEVSSIYMIQNKIKIKYCLGYLT